jgi:hypothetical protein
VLRVRYEDLASDTQATMARVFQFLGLPAVPFDGLLAAEEPHIVNGNPMRHGELFAVRADERWRTELQAANEAYFDRHAGAMSRALAYAGSEAA